MAAPPGPSPDRTGPPSRTGQGQGAVQAMDGHEGPSGQDARQGGPGPLDGLHKLTTRLARAHAVVVVEDLNVAGMTAKGAGRAKRGKAGLNRAILDVAPGELRRQLAYKSAWYGSGLVVADRWYPSVEDVLGLRGSENQTAAGRAHLQLRALWPGHRPGPQRALNLAASRPGPVPPVGREPAGDGLPDRERTGSCLLAGGRHRTAKTAPHQRVRLPPPPSNRRLHERATTAHSTATVPVHVPRGTGGTGTPIPAPVSPSARPGPAARALAGTPW